MPLYHDFVGIFYCSIEIYDAVNLKSERILSFADTLTTGRNVSKGLRREINSRQYNYIHKGTGFASTTSSSATKVDNYRFIGKQYYE